MFYDRFVELCRSRGLSPGGAAARIGFNRASINVWRSSGNPPKQELLVKIASFFSVTTDYLLGLEDKRAHSKRLIPVLGLVQAGRPVTAVTEALGFEEGSPDMDNGNELFALHIKGDSMEPRFREGDTVIVRRQHTAETGDIVVALVGDEDATIKKLCRTKDGILLQPLNMKYEPLFFSNEEIEEDPVKILGKVIELRVRF